MLCLPPRYADVNPSLLWIHCQFVTNHKQHKKEYNINTPFSFRRGEDDSSMIKMIVMIKEMRHITRTIRSVSVPCNKNLSYMYRTQKTKDLIKKIKIGFRLVLNLPSFFILIFPPALTA